MSAIINHGKPELAMGNRKEEVFKQSQYLKTHMDEIKKLNMWKQKLRGVLIDEIFPLHQIKSNESPESPGAQTPSFKYPG